MIKRFRVASLFGIPIELDVTFLLVVPLVTWLVGSHVDRLATTLNAALGVGVSPGAFGGVTPWLLGLAAALGLFASVVLHELGHSLVSMSYGYSIESITLWIFGGVADLSDQPDDWRRELAIAVAGPAVSVALALAGVGLLSVVPTRLQAIRFVLGYLALMNGVLAAFNLLPGFPMDGGRVLRALLARNRPYVVATRLAARVGQATAVVLAFVGLLGMNLFLLGIAFFVFVGAAGEAKQTALREALGDVTAADLMTPAADVVAVDEDTPLSDLLDRMYRERHTGYPVVDDAGAVCGVVTLEDVSSADDGDGVVGDVVTADLVTATPDTDAMTVFQQMQREGIGRVLVVDGDGDFRGLVSRTDVMTALAVADARGDLPGTGADVRRPVGA